MSEKTVKYCDVCEVEKKLVNKWWLCGVAEGVFFAFPHGQASDIPHGAIVKDACGKAHVTDLFNRFIEYGNLESAQAQKSFQPCEE